MESGAESRQAPVAKSKANHNSTVRECAVAATAALGAFVFLVWRASQFFPNAKGFLGHDYSWFLPTLLVGRFWQRVNGWWTPPDFTAAFCGGVPFLANPQNVFFSLPQLLMTALEPTQAMFATLVVSATLGAAGCFVLLRRYFRTSVSAATLGATLFLLNGFVFYRMVIGQLTYHAFAIIPVLACVVASAQRLGTVPPKRRLLRGLVQIVSGGLLIAYLTYGGALNFHIPAVLTVACVLLMLQMAQGFTTGPWFVLAGSCLWGVLLSAMKLAPAIVFAGQFPRPYLPDYLFADPLQLAVTMFVGFFAPAALPDGIKLSGAGLGRHEFEFGLSIVPLWMMFLALSRRRLADLVAGRRGQWAMLAGLLLIPIVLTIGPRQWGLFLLQIPVFNSNTTFVRWWALYLLPLMVMAARCFDVASPAVTLRSTMLLLCVAVIAGQEAAHNAPYYGEETTAKNAYDPTLITATYWEVEAGMPLPAITRIGRDMTSGPKPTTRSNDSFLEGASAWPCYEPIFGYELESLPRLGITTGSVTSATSDGHINLVDPSNYFRLRNRNSVSWRFDESRASAATLFAEHRPYEWNRPWWHRASTNVTVGALALSLAALIICGVQGLGFAIAKSQTTSQTIERVT
jgi:hypothetical protein